MESFALRCSGLWFIFFSVNTKLKQQAAITAQHPDALLEHASQGKGMEVTGNDSHKKLLQPSHCYYGCKNKLPAAHRAVCGAEGGQGTSRPDADFASRSCVGKRLRSLPVRSRKLLPGRNW
mmetsp:Transcript_82565/g.159515  ORF Transcript_82565/g.159515 Transcript_82565/m.159515 type:complete len:121 (+) Transcript_82565:293-655(+)